MSAPTSSHLARIAVDTDLCVKCGLCLPHCPTYVKTLDENESPRGRLALIQAWAAGKLQATPQLVGHVDRCLLCRACETACPAYVPYGRLVDDFRGEVGDSWKPLVMRAKIGAVRMMLQNARFKPVRALARDALQNSWLARSFGMKNVAAGLPSAVSQPHARQGFHPARGDELARVQLFLGCTAEWADAETVTATLELLTGLGVSVNVPVGQGCCGALAQHAGDRATAARLRLVILEAFADSGRDPVVSIASGCGAMLKEYRGFGGTGTANEFGGRVLDISQFLSGFLTSRPKPVFAPLEARACVHVPCSLKNVMKAGGYPLALLRQIPGLLIQPLAETTQCCGAAGSYLLEHPEMADALRDDVLDQVVKLRPDYLLTANVGCAMHLRSGLSQRGLTQVRVMHPVVLLAQQLKQQP